MELNLLHLYLLWAAIVICLGIPSLFGRHVRRDHIRRVLRRIKKL